MSLLLSYLVFKHAAVSLELHTLHLLLHLCRDLYDRPQGRVVRRVHSVGHCVLAYK